MLPLVRPRGLLAVPLLAAALVVAGTGAPTPASADVAGTGTLTYCGSPSLTTDNVAYDFSGTPTNLHALVGSLGGTLNFTLGSPGTYTLAAQSSPAGQLAFTSSGALHGSYHLVGNPMTVSGSAAASWPPSAVYRFSAKVDYVTASNNCYEGPWALNAALPVATPAGTNVSSSSALRYYDVFTGRTRQAAISVTFPAVLSGGTTRVEGGYRGTAFTPAGMLLDAGGFSGVVFGITTTATTDAQPARVCVDVADVNADGIVDGTAAKTQSLRILQAAPSGSFVDRTQLPIASGATRVCGDVATLAGTFAVAVYVGRAPQPVATFVSPVSYNHFGSSVAVQTVGGVIHAAIGAFSDDTAGVAGSGAVYRYTVPGASTPTVVLPPAPQAGGLFGFSVAWLGPDDLLVGEPGGGTVGRVHRIGPSGTTTLAAPAGAEGFGRAVAAVGSNYAVSATSSTSPGYVYLYDGTTNSLLRTFSGAPSAVGDYFGSSVAPFGSELLIVDPSRITELVAATGAVVRTIPRRVVGGFADVVSFGSRFAVAVGGAPTDVYDGTSATPILTVPAGLGSFGYVAAMSSGGLFVGGGGLNVGGTGTDVLQVDPFTGEAKNLFKSPTATIGFGDALDASPGWVLVGAPSLGPISRAYLFTDTVCGNTVTDGVEACDDGNLSDNDACKTDCTSNTCGDGVVRTGVEQCDDGNPNTGDGCEPTTCTLTPEAAAGTGSATTDPESDGATPSDPIETAVAAPSGGPISITETAAPPSPPAGYTAVGALVQITAPAASACAPLQLTFRIDASLLAFGQSAATLSVFRNGTALPNCTAVPPACISPTPACVAQRATLSDGDVQLVVASVAASDWFVATGGPCGDGVVSGLEECDDGNTAAGDCCSATCQLEPASTVCRPAAGACDAAETCTGGSPTCPADALAPNGTSCDDGDACTTGELCLGGACGNGSAVTCGTCEVCTPSSGCGLPVAPACQPALGGKASLLLKHATTSDKDVAVWKWVSSNAVLPEDFGSPTAATAYDFCIVDDDAGTPRLRVGARLPAGGLCATKPCWRALGTTGFRYVDKELTPDGVQVASLRSGSAAGKAKLMVKGKGASLALPHAALSAPVRARLQRTDGQGCWEARYSTPAVNDAAQLRATSD